jgi:ribosome-associated protein
MINASRSDEQSISAGAGADEDLTPERILAGIAEMASDRKALEVVALDLRGMVGYADYLLICSGRSDRQVKAIHDGIHAGLKQRHRLLPRRVEGFTEGRWVLLDYLDVVVHVFTPETREHYRLEQLWGEAPVVELDAVAV